MGCFTHVCFDESCRARATQNGDEAQRKTSQCLAWKTHWRDLIRWRQVTRPDDKKDKERPEHQPRPHKQRQKEHETSATMLMPSDLREPNTPISYCCDCTFIRVLPS
jgi:hypothetical protein